MAEPSHPDAEPQRKPTARELLEAGPGGLLTTTHLVELGLNRRAIEAVHRACPRIRMEGYSRALVRVEDYLEFLERSIYDGDRVGPGRAESGR